MEYAGNVAASARAAAAGSRDFLVEVDKARVAANLDLIGNDPACVPNDAYVRIRPDISLVKDPAKPPRGWLCAPGAISGVTYGQPFSLAPLGADLEPTFVLIDALGAYASGITSIVDDKGPDPAGDLTAAIDLARSAEGLLRSVAGGTPVVPAADDKRLTAVGDLITFISELQTEQDKVRRLRLFMANEAKTVAVIEALRNHLSAWELSRRSDENLRFVFAGVMISTVQKVDPPLPMSQRRDAAKAYYDRAAARITSAKLKPALDATLVEIKDADADLRRVLEKNPKLTDEEKAKLAQITRERLVRAFDTLTKLILSIKGA